MILTSPTAGMSLYFKSVYNLNLVSLHHEKYTMENNYAENFFLSWEWFCRSTRNRRYQNQNWEQSILGVYLVELQLFEICDKLEQRGQQAANHKNIREQVYFWTLL